MNKTTPALGFTLIELLVVVSIILLTTGAGIASFVNFNDRQQVQTTVKGIQGLMRSAQTKARAGEGANDCGQTGTLLNKLKGYQVTSTATAVILNRICVRPDTGDVTSTTERSRITLDTVTVSRSPSTTITFLALRGGVDLGNNPAVTITVAGQYSNVSYQFQVLNTGEITEGAFQ